MGIKSTKSSGSVQLGYF